jgi:polar amino acid transport system substrate-binding protein
LQSMVPASIKSSGTVAIATPSETPPEEFNNSSGQLVGYEIDIAKAVASELGLKAQFKITEFDSIIPGMQSGRYQLSVGQFGITSAREKVVDMVSLARLNEAFGVIKSSHITSMTQAGLCGHSVAIDAGSLEQQYATEQSQKCTAAGKPAIKVLVFRDDPSAWLAVQSGRAQIYWSGSTVVHYTVKASKIPAVVAGSDQTPTPTGILVEKSSGLASAVHAAMQHLIASGQYATIMKKWGVAAAEIKTSQLNPVESGS